jgi:uncharacterized protein with PIN domain
MASMRPQGLAPKPGLVNLRTEAPVFLCDSTVGALARVLRILGFDVAFSYDNTINHLIRESNISGRFLLTTSHEIDERTIARNAIRVPQECTKRQLEYIEAHIPLTSWIVPFTRCIRCNEPLHEIPKDRIREMVPPYIWDTYSRFLICPGCGHVYWPGSHREGMVEELMSDE